jgi:hypothetical protein
MEAESGDLAFRNWVLRQIRYLFMLEKVAWARSEKERLRIRKEKEEPIIQKLIEAVKDKLICGKPLPKSKFREALGYFSGLIPHLKNYINYPWARLDNNVAERAVRPIAIGRKNWLCVSRRIGGDRKSQPMHAVNWMEVKVLRSEFVRKLIKQPCAAIL